MEIDKITTAGEWVNKSWLSKILGVSVVKAEIEQLNDHGGAIAAMYRIHMTLEGRETKTAIIKTTKSLEEDVLAGAVQVGLPREAFFYAEFGDRVKPELRIPLVWSSHGDMKKGTKVLLMEDLEDCAQAGHFFGPTNPFNGGKDLEALTIGRGFHYSAEEITAAAFEQAAVMHAKFWGDVSLLEIHYLKGAAWMRGRDKESWQAWQDRASNAWAVTKAKIEAGASNVNWCPHLVEVIDASLSKVSWDTFQMQLSKRSFTFVHGDFHPGNVLVLPPSNELAALNLVLIDFEAVGVGCGPAEIAQFIISHMAPRVRRGCEEHLTEGYYNRLMSLMPEGQKYTLEQCRADYIAAGTAKWIWLLCLLSNMGLSDDMVQVFNDQVAAFVKDHGVTPENVEMPN
mmetsp:Transcript_37109/g.54567  ORF Transcript_37109/g.54567 Transcript_37109/m.54567 type:complete len:398 (+) Transcript_37109:145-1338(+)